MTIPGIEYDIMDYPDTGDDDYDVNVYDDVIVDTDVPPPCPICGWPEYSCP